MKTRSEFFGLLESSSILMFVDVSDMNAASGISDPWSQSRTIHRKCPLTNHQKQRRGLVSIHRSSGQTRVDALVSVAYVDDLKETVLHKIPVDRGTGMPN